MKLYKVVCKGMVNNPSGIAHGLAYVVAENSDVAYLKVKARLDKEDLGFSKDREMDRVELLADEAPYCDVGVVLYL